MYTTNNKNKLKKLVKESSMVGAGFATNGQGGSNDNSMYTYSIKPLTHVLEPKVSTSTGEEEIHIGLTISGKKLGDPKNTYTGKLIDIIRKNDDIKCYVILDERDKTKVKLNPTTVSIIRNDDIRNFGDDIWDFSLNGKGNLHSTRKNESRIVAESLDELNEEQIGFIQQGVKLHMNPEDLKDIEPWSRAISDEDGNLYVVDTPTSVHTAMIDFLHKKGMLATNARWDRNKSQYMNMIAWQRLEDTDNFYLSESYTRESLEDSRNWEEMNDLKELVKVENSQYNFHLMRIKDNEF
jgi:hypothetical protein